MKKRLLALLLAVVMLFTFAACSKPCTEHVDADNDLKCDECGTAVEPNTPENPDDPQDPANPNNPDTPNNPDNPNNGATPENPGYGADLINALITQIKTANSISLTLEVDEDVEYLAWDTDESKYVTDEDMAMSVVFEVVLTKAESSKYGVDMKLVGTATMTEGDSEPDVETIELYFIGDYMYTRESGDEFYFKAPIPSVDEDAVNEMAAAVDLVLAKFDELGVEITEDDINAAIDAIGAAITNNVELKNGNISVDLDLAAPINDVKDYVIGIDANSKTVEAVIDDVLALAADVTVADLLEVLDGCLELTVNEAIAEIDAFLTAEADTTLQGLYDKIVTNEKFTAALLMYAQAEGATEEEYNEALTMIQSINFADLIAENELGDVVLYTLVIPYIYGAPDGNYPTQDQLFVEINAMLDTTLSQAFGSTVDMIKLFAANITLDELNATLLVELDSKYNITKISNTYAMDLVYPMVGGQSAPEARPEDTEPLSLESDEYKMPLISIVADESIVIIPSNDTVTIALPANAQVRWDCSSINDYELATTDSSFGDMYMYYNDYDPDEDPYCDGHISVYPKEMSTSMSVDFTLDTLPNDIPDSITVTINYAYIANENGEPVYYDSEDFVTAEFVITFDHENQTFSFELPELVED